MSTPRHWPAAAVASGKLYVMGGHAKILNQFRTVSHCKYPDAIALVEEANRLNIHGRLATALLAWDTERSEAPDGGYDGEGL